VGGGEELRGGGEGSTEGEGVRREGKIHVEWET
jgi:hypothetical protein